MAITRLHVDIINRRNFPLAVVDDIVVPANSMKTVSYFTFQENTDLCARLANLVARGHVTVMVDSTVQTPAEVAHLWEYPLGGGGSALTIRDEGVDVMTDVAILNFIGADVIARDDGDPDQVNIYIPPPTFVSHYNTSDGSNVCTVANTGTAARHVANPGVYSIGGWVAGSVNPTLRTATTSFDSNNQNCSFEDELSTVEVNIAGSDDNFGAPIATHTTAALTTGNTPFDTTVDNIRIRVDDGGGAMTPDSTKFKARIRVDVNIAAILPNSGRFSVQVIHNTGPGYTFTQGPLFYDSESNTAGLNGTTTITETGGSVVTRQVSGVYYYTDGSEFTIDVDTIDDLNGDSYPQNQQMSVDGSDYGLPTLTNIHSTDFGGWTNDWDDDNDTYNKTDWALPAGSNFCTVDPNAIVTPTIYDWGIADTQNSAADAIAVNTYTPNATRIYDDFRLEEVGAEAGAVRLESDLVTTWDNTQDVNLYDGGTGMQYQCSRLIYPQTNFGGYDPNPGIQPDYSASGGARIWYRRFWHTGVSHPVGRFRLTDHSITEGDLAANNVIIEISLDGVAWYTLNGLYSGGPLGPGDPCRTDKDVYGLPGNAPDPENNQLAFSFGTGGFTGAGTGGGWGMYIRITYAGGQTGKYIGSLAETTWV
jgi:hypothetical protein